MKLRMKNGILKRGDRWAAVVSLGRFKDPVTGRVRQRQTWRTFDTYQEAQRFRVQARAARQDGTFVAPSKMTLGDFLDEWMGTVEDGLAKGTAVNYRDIIRAHFHRAPADRPDLVLASLPLAAITPEVIEKYLSAKRIERRPPRKGQKEDRPPIASGTIRKHYHLLHTALRAAVRWGKLARNPAALVDHKPRDEAAEVRPWDQEEVRLFLAQAKRTAPRAHPLFLTAILTGLRLGELAGLTWADVSFETRTLEVARTFYRIGKDQGTKDPKSKAGRRVIALSPAVLEALEQVKAQQAEERRLLGADYHDGGLVFCQVNGKPLHGHNLSQRVFRRVITKAGLRRVKFHSLRHLHMTFLHAAGVPSRVAQERLGHADARLSLGVYTHTLPGQHEAAAAAVEAAVLGRTTDHAARADKAQV